MYLEKIATEIGKLFIYCIKCCRENLTFNFPGYTFVFVHNTGSHRDLFI